MFAEFEKIIHEKVESDVPLTNDLICQIVRQGHNSFAYCA